MIKIVAKFPLKVNHNINKNVISAQITQFYPNYLFGNAASDIQFLKISAIGNKLFSTDVDKNSEHMAILHSTFTNGKCNFIKITCNFVFFSLGVLCSDPSGGVSSNSTSSERTKY
mgnify:CR=1 FL=1